MSAETPVRDATAGTDAATEPRVVPPRSWGGSHADIKALLANAADTPTHTDTVEDGIIMPDRVGVVLGEDGYKELRKTLMFHPGVERKHAFTQVGQRTLLDMGIQDPTRLATRGEPGFQVMSEDKLKLKIQMHLLPRDFLTQEDYYVQQCVIETLKRLDHLIKNYSEKFVCGHAVTGPGFIPLLEAVADFTNRSQLFFNDAVCAPIPPKYPEANHNATVKRLEKTREALQAHYPDYCRPCDPATGLTELKKFVAMITCKNADSSKKQREKNADKMQKVKDEYEAKIKVLREENEEAQKIIQEEGEAKVAAQDKLAEYEQLNYANGDKINEVLAELADERNKHEHALSALQARLDRSKELNGDLTKRAREQAEDIEELHTKQARMEADSQQVKDLSFEFGFRAAQRQFVEKQAFVLTEPEPALIRGNFYRQAEAIAPTFALPALRPTVKELQQRRGSVPVPSLQHEKQKLIDARPQQRL